MLKPAEKENLIKNHGRNKAVIRDFLKKTKDRSDEHLASELMFCLQTAQSSARNARRSVEKLKEGGILFTATEPEILENMESVRFAERKAGYLYRARGKLPRIKNRLDMGPFELRVWLVENIDGMGMKLASHFMRNIGIFGLAILDVHVQRFMKQNDLLVGNVGKLNTRQYLENERRFLRLSRELGIPPQELDITVWMQGNATGEFYG